MTTSSCLLVVLLAVSSAPQVLRIVPKDQAAGDRSFETFRAALRAAAESCDESVLWPLFAEDLDGPGGRKGLAEARTYFEINRRDQQASTLPICGELVRALALGTAKRQHTYCAPYAVCMYPEPTLWGTGEREGHAVAVGPKVRVHREPSPSAPVIDFLSYEVVQACGRRNIRVCSGVANPPQGWYAVASPRVRVGYVRADDVLIPSGNFQFDFARRPGGWRVVSVFMWE